MNGVYFGIPVLSKVLLLGITSKTDIMITIASNSYYFKLPYQFVPLSNFGITSNVLYGFVIGELIGKRYIYIPALYQESGNIYLNFGPLLKNSETKLTFPSTIIITPQTMLFYITTDIQQKITIPVDYSNNNKFTYNKIETSYVKLPLYVLSENNVPFILTKATATMEVKDFKFEGTYIGLIKLLTISNTSTGQTYKYIPCYFANGILTIENDNYSADGELQEGIIVAQNVVLLQLTNTDKLE